MKVVLLAVGRGSRFARTVCAETILVDRYPQASVSWKDKAGTLRGLHFQAEPHPEAKRVRATAGRVFDGAVDLRPSSPPHGVWTSVILDAARRNTIYIPAGGAHGSLTLEDRSEVSSLISDVQARARPDTPVERPGLRHRLAVRAARHVPRGSLGTSLGRGHVGAGRSPPVGQLRR